jgi:hypothetical protein
VNSMRGLRLAFLSSMLLALSGGAAAQSEPIPGPATDVYPGARVYEWTFYVPVVSTERHEIVVSGPNVVVRSKRIDYQTPGLRYERRSLGWVPELYCKYPDWFLPNECGVEWHKVYADFPQLTMRREHVDVEVPEVTAGERTIRVDVPRVTWTERRLRIAVPFLATEPQPAREWSQTEGTMVAGASLDRARGALEDGRRESLKAIDEALATVNAGIAAVEAQGGDGSKLAAADGSRVDLYATRRSLEDDKATQLKRYAEIRGALDAASKPPSAD